MSDALWVAADVGNSAIKLLAVKAEPNAESDELVERAARRTVSLLELDWQAQVTDWVESRRRKISSRAGVSWWVSTVNRAASGRLHDASRTASAASDRNDQWHPFRHHQIPMAVAVDVPDRLGIDRLVGAYAAARRHNGPLVVVDVGSAVTVDWVRTGRTADAPSLADDVSAGVFCGGAIFPGIRLQTAALSTGTEGLRQPASGGFPAAADRTPTLPPGRNTEDAIRIGVIAAVVGAIERLSADYPVQAGHELSADPPTVVVSGGDGPLISDHLQIPHVQIPHLVCRGLLDLALKRCRSTAGGLK